MTSAKSIFREMTSGPGLIETMSNFIIRPQRAEYELSDLGPELFRTSMASSEQFHRTDLALENMRGMTLQCSWFKPCRHRRAPCIVYCHANCGSRCDSLEVLYLLDHGFTLFAFDCSGSGMSEGKYISLGCYERQDLAAVVEYLDSQRDSVNGIGLYGRSMGSVTSIMYAAKDAGIRAIVCDSPFASLREIISDLVANFSPSARYIPSFLITGIVDRIRRKIAKLAAFDIDDLNTIKYAILCTVPTLIIHGAEDTFVRPKHSIAIMEAYRGPCIHQLISGGHNDERDAQTEELVASFLRLYLIEKRSSRAASAGSRAASQTDASDNSSAPFTHLASSVHATDTHANDVRKNKNTVLEEEEDARSRTESATAKSISSVKLNNDSHTTTTTTTNNSNDGADSSCKEDGNSSKKRNVSNVHNANCTAEGSDNATAPRPTATAPINTNFTLTHNADHDLAARMFYDLMQRTKMPDGEAVLTVPLPSADTARHEADASANTARDERTRTTPMPTGVDSDDEDQGDRHEVRVADASVGKIDSINEGLHGARDSIHAHAAMTTPQPLHLTKPHLRLVNSASTTNESSVESTCDG